jgi:TfoX N-terminal domain
MAYDQGLATRIREAIGDRSGLAEKQMFGGLAFLVHGNMACGVRGEDLIVRLAADAADAHAEDDDLRRWVDRGVAYAASLPPKAH